jgi:hypothetical protein
LNIHGSFIVQQQLPLTKPTHPKYTAVLRSSSAWPLPHQQCPATLCMHTLTSTQSPRQSTTPCANPGARASTILVSSRPDSVFTNSVLQIPVADLCRAWTLGSGGGRNKSSCITNETYLVSVSEKQISGYSTHSRHRRTAPSISASQPNSINFRYCCRR